MRKKGEVRNKIIVVLIIVFVLTACSSNPDAQQYYVKEQPLQVVFTSAGSYESASEQKIKFNVQQNEKQAEQLQFVHVSVWNAKRTFELEMVEANEEKDGSYSLVVDFPKEGLYYVQIHTGNKREIITPTKRLIVGKLTEDDKALLKSGAKTNSEESGHHH